MAIGVTGDFVPLGSFKIIDGKYIGGAITGSAVSSSGELYASLSYDPSLITDGVVVYDTATGQFYYTGSYGAGGGGGALVVRREVGRGGGAGGRRAGGRLGPAGGLRPRSGAA